MDQQNATPNSGGGGGSQFQSQNSAAAAGVVLIRYKSSSNLATGGTITTQGAYKVHKFTSNGTFTVS